MKKRFDTYISGNNSTKSISGNPLDYDGNDPRRLAEKWDREALKFRLLTLYFVPPKSRLANRQDLRWDKSNDAVRKAVVYTLDPATTGECSREVIQFLRRPLRELPQYSLREIVQQNQDKGITAQTPCRISYIGKPLAVGLSWRYFRDLLGLRIEFLTNFKFDEGSEDNIATSLNMNVPRGNELPNEIRAAIANKLEVYPDFVTGLFKSHSKSVASAQDVLDNLALIFVPIAWFSNLSKWAGSLQEVGYREVDCPTTPDGAWIIYQDTLIRADWQKKQKVEQNPCSVAISTEEDGAPSNGSLDKTPEERSAEGNEEAGITTATVAEARKRLRQQKFDALPDVLQGFDAFQALYAAAENKGFVEKTFAGTPMVVDRLRDEAIRMERNNDETERERLRELSGGKISPARALGTVVKGRLVFADKQVFKAMQQRRYSGRAMLRCLGKRPPYILPDIHVLAPHEFGQVPGFVAGQHRLQRDRLCVVMISYDPALWDLSLRERKALIEANKGPKLWVFPRQWLFDLSSAYHWWDAGWFGTPKDPSVLDFVVPDDDYQI